MSRNKQWIEIPPLWNQSTLSDHLRWRSENAPTDPVNAPSPSMGLISLSRRTLRTQEAQSESLQRDYLYLLQTALSGEDGHLFGGKKVRARAEWTSSLRHFDRVASRSIEAIAGGMSTTRSFIAFIRQVIELFFISQTSIDEPLFPSTALRDPDCTSMPTDSNTRKAMSRIAWSTSVSNWSISTTRKSNVLMSNSGEPCWSRSKRVHPCL